MKNIKVRPSIMLGISCLTGIAIHSANLGMMEVVMGCVVGITALLPKLVESEEKGD